MVYDILSIAFRKKKIFFLFPMQYYVGNVEIFMYGV